MATLVNCFTIQGIDGYPVDIEIKTLEGQPAISIIGLGDLALKEAAERIQAAIDESGFVFPKKRVIISLAPGDKKKSGSHFDLAMAIGVLIQNQNISVKNLSSYGFIGELSLDGRLRSCKGILPMVIAAKKKLITKLIIPTENLAEASLVHGIELLGFEHLTDVLRFLEGRSQFTAVPSPSLALSSTPEVTLDFSDVRRQQELIESITLAAAGGHNLLMIGESECRKTMIAQRIPTLFVN